LEQESRLQRPVAESAETRGAEPEASTAALKVQLDEVAKMGEAAHSKNREAASDNQKSHWFWSSGASDHVADSKDRCDAMMAFSICYSDHSFHSLRFF